MFTDKPTLTNYFTNYLAIFNSCVKISNIGTETSLDSLDSLDRHWILLVTLERKSHVKRRAWQFLLEFLGSN